MPDEKQSETPEETSAEQQQEQPHEELADHAESLIEEEHPSVEELLKELDQSREDLLAAKDAQLRAEAEMQNVRRRSEQEVIKARKFALEKFAGDLLDVVDNLERGLEAAADADEAVKEGIELTMKSLIDTLARYGVTAVNPMGEAFDPQQHEAMAMVPNPSMDNNLVMDVMQKGYLLNERLLRAAKVVIVKND